METDLNEIDMRDLFAMFAMAGMLAGDEETKNDWKDDETTAYYYSVKAYSWADTMILARRHRNAT
jgi:hypothetical protein